jgi:SpoVK/Ycf46/Vps4 family AAA+-type ATPase
MLPKITEPKISRLGKVPLYKKSKDFDLNFLSQKTDGFNGADIEAVVNEAVENCFLAVVQLDNKALTDVIVNTIGSVTTHD